MIACFFFQAEDGIRDHCVTGVQTCALPIFDKAFSMAEAIAIRGGRIVQVGKNDAVLATKDNETKLVDLGGKFVLPGLIDSHTHPTGAAKIGRASCRERVKKSEGAGTCSKKG